MSTPKTASIVPQSKVAPVVDVSAKPAGPAATGSTTAPAHNSEALAIAGGVLGFLAVGGAAVAMTRRRREDEEWTEERVHNEPAEPETAVQSQDWSTVEEEPAIIAPSAFKWDGPASDREPAVRKSDESHVERAYRGPTPENPSLSLRKRLKRAAFMDKREREAAAGVSEPVDATAGLPDRVVEQREREFA